MKIKRALSMSIVLIFFITIIGCGKKIDYSDISNYSDDILNSIILSLTQSDYNTFSSLLSDDLKESYDYDTFQKESRLLLDNLGMVEKIEFEAGEDKNGYISAIYNGTFTDEPDNVRISISYKKDDPDHKVYQIYMSSPKITESISNN